MDSGGHGLVTFQDFLTSLALLLHGSAQDRLDWLFRL